MFCSLTKTYVLYSIIKSNGIHSSGFLRGSRQTGNAMRKVLGISKKKKFHFSEVPNMPNPDVFSKGSFEGKHSGNSRRASVLNKLFMRHITDQMAAGECAYVIFGHGIEINRVQVTPDYKILKVYWTTKSTDDVEAILQKCAGILRHELSQLRVMGNVPIIQFIKDKQYANIVELDTRLASADFGAEYIGLNIAEKYKTQFEISAPLDNNIKEKLKELDNQESEMIEDLPLPPMPQNVFGVPHAEILNRINMTIKKSKALHRHRDSTILEQNELTLTTVNKDPIYLGDPRSERAAFKEFLHKRQLIRLKAKKANRDLEPDLDYLEELYENEMNLNRLNEMDNEDFIFEDIDEKNE